MGSILGGGEGGGGLLGGLLDPLGLFGGKEGGGLFGGGGKGGLPDPLNIFGGQSPQGQPMAPPPGQGVSQVTPMGQASGVSMGMSGMPQPMPPGAMGRR